MEDISPEVQVGMYEWIGAANGFVPLCTSLADRLKIARPSAKLRIIPVSSCSSLALYTKLRGLNRS